MADIFISYARADRDRVEKLASALEAEGFSIWWDQQIAGGSEFSKDIERELRAAKAVIVAWSDASSSSSWVKDEATIAAEEQKLVAISLDGEMPPIGFRQYHTIDFNKGDEAAFKNILRSANLKIAPDATAATPVVSPQAARKFTSKNHALLAITGIAVLIGASVIGLQFLGSNHPADSVEDSVSVTAEAEARAASVNYDSIAVLAFADLSTNRDQEYFSDGIAEELLNLLANKTDLSVAARTSSFAFKGRNESINAIGVALNVDTVLEGSVRKAGDRLRITAQLIDVRTGFHLWSETYDRELADIFALQDEIANAIVNSLPAIVGDISRGNPQRVNDNAYDLFLQGRHQLALRTPASIESAKDLFEQSLAIDPEFAPAWAELATSAMLLSAGQATYGDLTQEEVLEIAEPAVAKAFSLGPTLAETQVANAFLKGYIGDRDASLASYRRAIEINPSVANARHLLYLALVNAGDFAEAFEIIDRAVELDPLSAITLENHVNSLIARGRFDDALAASIRLYNLHPNWPHSLTALARAQASRGNFAEGAKLIELAADRLGSDNLDIETAFFLLNARLFEHPRVVTAPVDPRSFYEVTQGEAEAAQTRVLEYLNRFPQNPFVLWRALWTLWATGDAAGALKLGDDFAAKQENTVASWAIRNGSCYPGIYLAGLRQRSGDIEGAEPLLRACREALEEAERQGAVRSFFERDAIAELLVLEGRHDAALEELQRLLDSGEFISWWIYTEPIYEPLWDDPRFLAIVAGITQRADAEGARYRAFPVDIKVDALIER